MFDDSAKCFLSLIQPTGNRPQLLSVVQVKRSHRAGSFRSLHALNNDFRSCRRQSRKNSAAVEPATTAGEDFIPINISGLQHAGSFVRSVVEHDWSSNAATLVAVNSRHVWATHTVMLVHFVKRLHAHRSDAFVNQVAQRRINHRGRDACVHAEAIGQVGCTIELATANVDRKVVGFAERNTPRVEPVHHGSE